MAHDKLLDGLISVLYEAVLDSSRWHEAVELCSHYSGGVNAQLSTIAKKDNSMVACVAAGMMMSEKIALDYAHHYIAIDPHQALLQGSVVHEWQCNDQTFDKNFVSGNEFYQDFLIPQGFHYGIFAVVDDGEDYLSSFGITRTIGQKPFDNEDQLAARQFSQHLQRALRLQRHTQNLQTKAELGALAIDALAIPMMIIDQKGVIRHLNADAERFLSDKEVGLICKMGLLTAMSSTNKNKLLALIASASHYPAMGGGMLLQGNDGNCQVFVTPLPASSVFVRDWQSPLVLVLVLESGKNLSTLQLLGSLYDLSPAELRVASALLNGKSPEHYAHEAKVSLNTVRTQLKSLFRKTGACRQSELVALLSQLPPLHNECDRFYNQQKL